MLTPALESLKIVSFNGLLLTKVYNVWDKKVQGSYPSWHWRVTKFEGKLTCQFKIDMRSLINFDPSTQKSKIFSL